MPLDASVTRFIGRVRVVAVTGRGWVDKNSGATVPLPSSS